jgi:hypothetical protein
MVGTSDLHRKLHGYIDEKDIGWPRSVTLVGRLSLFGPISLFILFI